MPEAEAQVAALGQQILTEVVPGSDEPQASAIDGRMYQAQGPLWHKRDREQAHIPARLPTWIPSRRGPRVAIAGGCKGIAWCCKAWCFPRPYRSLPGGVRTRWGRAPC